MSEKREGLSTAPDPWERQHKEGAKAFSAFIAYRDLSATERSLRRAVLRQYGEFTSSRIRQFQHWSAKFKWVSRALAWDQYVDERAREDLIEQVKKARTRHVQVSQAIQAKALSRLKEMDAMELAPHILLRFLTEGIRLERLSLGEPETTVRQVVDEIIATEELDFTQLNDGDLYKLLTRKGLSEELQQTISERSGAGNSKPHPSKKEPD